jgi:hypothetical protein
MVGFSFYTNPHSGFCGAQTWPTDTPLLRGTGTTLGLSKVNSLSSEEKRIDGPDAGAKHCQGGTESGQHNAIPYLASSRRDAPQFDDYDQCSGHGCP